MGDRQTLYWAGLYAAAWVLATVAGVGLLVGGYFLGIDVAWANYTTGESTLRAAARTAAPGLVVAVVGLVIWRVVTAWALYRTLLPAIRADLSETYDNERVKSEILAVLDERLSDMQQDIQGVQRAVRNADGGETETGFEFDD